MSAPKVAGCTPKDCRTCLFMATHEDCNKDGGCLNTPEDYAQYRATGVMPENRYRHWVEATSPMQQMERLHQLQLTGARNIVLGPGEAEVSTRQSPQEASEQLHYVAEQCGYFVSNLTTDKADGVQRLTVFKDFGPFVLEWEKGQLVRIMQGEKKPRAFWSRERAF